MHAPGTGKKLQLQWQHRLVLVVFELQVTVKNLFLEISDICIFKIQAKIGAGEILEFV